MHDVCVNSSHIRLKNFQTLEDLILQKYHQINKISTRFKAKKMRLDSRSLQIFVIIITASLHQIYFQQRVK